MTDYKNKIEKIAEKTFGDIKDVNDLKRQLNGKFVDNDENTNKNKSDSSKKESIKEEKYQKSKIDSTEKEQPNSFKELSIEELRRLSPDDLVVYETKLLRENKKLELRKGEIKKGNLQFELEKLDKKSEFQKTFAKFGKKLSVLKENTINKIPRYKKYSEFMSNEKDNKWQKLGKRIIISGTLGIAAGAGATVMTSGGIFLAGAVGGGLALKRVVARFAAGAGAGLLHKQFTKKRLEKNIQEKSVGQYFKDLEEKDVDTNKELGVLARNKELIKRLRKEKEDGTISDEDRLKFKTIEEIRKNRAEEIKALTREIRKQRDEIRIRLIAKNERNNVLIAAAAGFVTSLSLRYGAEVINHISHFDTLHIDNTNIGAKDVSSRIGDKNIHADGSSLDNGFKNKTVIQKEIISKDHNIVHEQDVFVNNEVTTDSSVNGNLGGHNITNVQVEKFAVGLKVEDVPTNVYIHKGDGITQILKRQFDNNPELAKKFGITNGDGKEYSELAKKLGYLNDEYEVKLKLDANKGYFATLDKNGNPIVLELDKSGNVIEKSYFNREFEGKDIEKRYEYLGKRSTEIITKDNVDIDTIESKRIGDLGEGRMDLSRTEITDEDGIIGRRIGNLDSNSNIDLSGTVNLDDATTGKEVFDNHADILETINKEMPGDTKNLLITYFKDTKNPFIRFGSNLEVKSLGDNYLKVKVPRGMTAIIEYDKDHNMIKSVMYHSYKNGMHSEFIDSNGDGKIDRYVHSHNQIGEKDYLRRDFRKNKFINDSGEYIIEFKDRNGIEEMIMSSNDNKVVLRDHNEIEKIRSMITKTESIDINKFK